MKNIFRARDFFWPIVFVFSVFISLRIGATANLDWPEIYALRLPRTILAFSVGAALSVAGAALQAYFKNPLCEPYTLGVSSGATLGAVLGRTLGLGSMSFGFSPTALLGALFFSSILFFASRKRVISTATLLLVGVMLGFLGSSLVAVWMAIGEDSRVQSAMSWLLGDLSRAEEASSIAALFAVTAGTIGLFVENRKLDALLLGEEEANAMGIDVRRLRMRVILWTSLLVAVSVSLSGMIGFVGLIVPQWIRRTGSALHARVLPLAAITGGSVLVLADTVARSVIAPYELPVGVITAIVGAPFFIMLLLRRRGVAMKIELRKLSLAFGDRTVLKDLSLVFEPGRIIGLIGPNGAGKSSLLRALNGFFPLQSGEVFLGDSEIRSLSVFERARRMTYVGDELDTDFPVTIEEFVRMGAHSKGGLFDSDGFEKVMDETGCTSQRDRTLAELSSGERQRAHLARALFQNSKWICLDESFSRLDLHHQAKFGALLKKYTARGFSFLFVSHDLNFTTDWADDCILLMNGECIANGSTSTVITRENLRRLYPEAKIEFTPHPVTGNMKVFFQG